MRIAATSDLHGYLPDLEPCNICVISGDITPLKYQKDYKKCKEWFKTTFTEWVEKQPVSYIVFIPGNHDFSLYKKWIDNDTEQWWPDNIYCLIDETIELLGIKICGTPWISGLPNWAFNKDEGEELTEFYKRIIPDECDIVLTHAAPAIDMLGVVLQKGWNYMSNFSSVSLANAYKDKKIKYAFNGHIHSGIHSDIECHGTIFRNVSLLDEDYKPVYPIYYFDL